MIFVVLHKIKNGGSQQLENDAYVPAVVEPIEHFDAQVLAGRVLFVEFFEDVDFQFGRLSVLVHALDDLDGDPGPLSPVKPVMVHYFRHFAERPFAQVTYHFVSSVNEVARKVNEMAFRVVGRRHR